MAKYRLTNLAVQDLSDIWDYTVKSRSEEQADSYYEQLALGFQRIASNPDTGRNYSEIINDLYGLKVNRHIIFYRFMSPDKVEIVRILHERMDLRTHL